MFERIVVPLDGSELAEAVVGQVRRILLHKDAEVILVRAVVLPADPAWDSPELPAIMQGQAANYLSKIAGDLSVQGASVRTVTRVGIPADVILDVAAEEQATLITMTTHGRSGIARWTFGSVAEKVLRASRIPVLALRSFAGVLRKPISELPIGKILVPIDASDLSLEVVPPAAELATLFGSHVVLINVCEDQACSIPVPQMTEAYERFRAAGVSVEPLMKQGDPAFQILEACCDQKADLIAISTHGRTGASRWLLGSVTEKVLRSSSVPILIVRPLKAAIPRKEESLSARAGST
jgi:nucleotide-binding universal stress UspA family protein